jgi:hypothetical protein
MTNAPEEQRKDSRDIEEKKETKQIAKRLSIPELLRGVLFFELGDVPEVRCIRLLPGAA